jgi:predicted CopG family antitoxin
MAKMIAVKVEVYTKLKKLKGKHSFSAAIDGLLERGSVDMRRYFGALRERSDLDRIEAEITANRKTAGLKRRRVIAGV